MKTATWKFNPNSHLGFGKLTTSRGRVLHSNISLDGAIRDYPEFSIVAEGHCSNVSLHRMLVEGFYCDSDAVRDETSYRFAL